MTAESHEAEEAGRIIYRTWIRGDVIEALPDTCRPGTVARGYAAQRAGDIVTTGVCGKPSAIAAGNHVVVELGAIGTAEVILT